MKTNKYTPVSDVVPLELRIGVQLSPLDAGCKLRGNSIHVVYEGRAALHEVFNFVTRRLSSPFYPETMGIDLQNAAQGRYVLRAIEVLDIAPLGEKDHLDESLAETSSDIYRHETRSLEDLVERCKCFWHDARVYFDRSELIRYLYHENSNTVGIVYRHAPDMIHTINGGGDSGALKGPYWRNYRDATAKDFERARVCLPPREDPADSDNLNVDPGVIILGVGLADNNRYLATYRIEEDPDQLDREIECDELESRNAARLRRKILLDKHYEGNQFEGTQGAERK
jgi:hypothetical protein